MIKKLCKEWFLLLLILLIAACSTSPEKKVAEQEAIAKNRQQALNHIQDALFNEQEPDQEPFKVPSDIQNSLLPESPYLSLADPQTVNDQHFDIAVKNAYARTFFMGLVKGSQLNMVIHPDVKGKITLSLKNVTLDEVLETTREIYGYEYKKQHNGYLILPARMQSRIFHVNYLNVSRHGSSSVNVSAGQLASSSSGSTNQNSNNSSTANTSQNSTGTNSVGVIGTQINTETEADFWASIKQSVSNIIGKKNGRSVVVSPQAGLVVVRAMPSELRDVQAFLESAQNSLQRQVVLEAKIIEVTLNEASKNGIDWAGLRSETGYKVVMGEAGLSNGAAESLNSAATAESLLTANATASAFPTGGVFAVGAQVNNFVAMLKILRSQGDAQVLSSPRIATLNNQKAVIKVGQDEFFVTGVQSSNNTTNTTGATTSTPTVSLSPFFSGIALDVTPQITDDNQVILHIHPQVSDIKDQVKSFTVFGQQQTLPMALSAVRESDSIIKAKNNQIIVIGGLMQEKTANQNANNFGLADVPFIGGLFKQKNIEKVRSELVILLKPTIIKNQSVWQKQLQGVRQRVNQIYQ